MLCEKNIKNSNCFYLNIIIFIADNTSEGYGSYWKIKKVYSQTFEFSYFITYVESFGCKYIIFF